MSLQKIKKNLPLLKVLCVANRKQIYAIITFADKDLILSIAECISNVLHGNVPVNIQSLKKYKYVFKRVTIKKIGIKQLKDIFKVLSKNFYISLLTPVFEYIQEK